MATATTAPPDYWESPQYFQTDPQPPRVELGGLLGRSGEEAMQISTDWQGRLLGQWWARTSV